MSVAVASTGRRKTTGFVLLVFISFAVIASTSCGTSSGKSSSNNNNGTPPPTQPNYPSIPPEAITWPISDPASSQYPAPPAEDQSTAPWKNGANDFPLTVTSPSANSSLTSPVNVVANASPTNPIFFMRIYVDQLAVYYTANNSVNTQVFIAPGSHTLTVMAEDQKGYISATPLQITVSAQAPSTQGQTVISGIQAMPGWQSCGGLFPAGSQRAGQICAAGGGTPTSSMKQNVSSPALDGNAAQFSMAPATPDCSHYCNMLYFNPVAGGDNVSHFIYDLYFYIDNPDAPQALEFDVNQTFGGQRWVWGSECNFKGSGMWDIWNDAPNTGWIPTTIPCTAFPANTWIHLVWQLERVGNQVHYISLTVGTQTYNVDVYYPNQQGWTLEEIDNAFQMDLNANGDPYNVWLDKVNLTAY
jgi:hypothetical protein